MKVLDLQCSARHLFEGWFASETDFQTQRSRLMVACPLCGDVNVSKRLSAPRLNLCGNVARDESEEPAMAGMELALAEDLQEAWLAAARQIVAQSEDVGMNFSAEARRIHYGESQQRAIRGVASPAQAAALIDEGINVVSFALPESFKKTLQ